MRGQSNLVVSFKSNPPTKVAHLELPKPPGRVGPKRGGNSPYFLAARNLWRGLSSWQVGLFPESQVREEGGGRERGERGGGDLAISPRWGGCHQTKRCITAARQVFSSPKVTGLGENATRQTPVKPTERIALQPACTFPMPTCFTDHMGHNIRKFCLVFPTTIVSSCRPSRREGMNL